MSQNSFTYDLENLLEEGLNRLYPNKPGNMITELFKDPIFKVDIEKLVSGYTLEVEEDVRDDVISEFRYKIQRLEDEW